MDGVRKVGDTWVAARSRVEQRRSTRQLDGAVEVRQELASGQSGIAAAAILVCADTKQGGGTEWGKRIWKRGFEWAWCV